MDLKPRLSGEGSIVTSLAVAALAIGVYNAAVGPIADAHQTNANDPNLLAATRKAGWTALIFVGAVSVLSRDPNIVILGGAAVITQELCYRHAIMTNPATGKIHVTPDSYMPAGGNVTPVGDLAPALAG